MSFRNKKLTATVVLGLVISGLAGCQSTSQESKKEPNINEVQAQHYNGPKARIAVARFTDKSNNSHWWKKEIGDGMADQLTTALVKTNRFIVLERQALDAVLSEQDLAVSGRVSSHTAAAYGEIEGAEIVVVAAVTEFDYKNKGVKTRSSGFMGDMISSVSAGFSGSHMAIDLRVIDTRTSRILAATTVEGGTKDFDFGAAATNFGSSMTGGGLQGWANTPQEKALREVIVKAVAFLEDRVPDTYYRYNANNTLVAGATPPPAPKPKITSTVEKAEPQPTRIALSVPSGRMTNPEKMDLTNARGQLNCLGYLRGEKYEDQDVYDVTWDQETVNAIAEFQTDNGLSVNGRTDKKTLNKMAEHNCMAKQVESSFGALANWLGAEAKPVTQNYQKEDVRVHKPTKQGRDSGTIYVTHDNNEPGLTEIYVVSKHKDSGGELTRAKGYLYEMNGNALAAKGEFIQNKQTEIINSGKHYIKFAFNDKFFATGEIELKKGVKNVVTLELE